MTIFKPWVLSSLLSAIIPGHGLANDSCVTQTKSNLLAYSFSAEYDIRCSGEYIFFLGLDLKEHIKKIKGNINRPVVFIDQNNPDSRLEHQVPLKYTQRVLVDGKLFEEYEVAVDVHLGNLATSHYIYRKGLFNLGVTHIQIEVSIFDSDDFKRTFSISEPKKPMRRGLFFK